MGEPNYIAGAQSHQIYIITPHVLDLRAMAADQGQDDVCIEALNPHRSNVVKHHWLRMPV